VEVVDNLKKLTIYFTVQIYIMSVNNNEIWLKIIRIYYV